MTEPFVGEVQIFGFPFPPRSWALAAGQTIAIRQNTTLFALYGTTFGGDGVTTFALPNLASRQAGGAGQSPGNSRRNLGDVYGTPGVALTQAETPTHLHSLNDYIASNSSDLAATPTATSGIGYVGNGSFSPFAAPGQMATFNPSAIGISGSGAQHENRQPFLGLNYSVALVGLYPTFD